MKFRRLIAYIIDFMFITFMTSSISQINFLNPYLDKFYETSDKYLELYEDIIENQDVNALTSDNFTTLLYDLNKYNINVSLIEIICFILYYVGFQFWNNGQTLGKKLMKLKVVDKSNNKASFWQLLFRTVILFGLYGQILNLLVFKLASKSTFLSISPYLSSIVNTLNYAVVLTILIRSDGRGLHDLISNTKVIDLKKSN